MDIRIQRIFLGLLLAIFMLTSQASAADEVGQSSEQSSEEETISDEARTQPVRRAVELIDPKVKRREIDIADIDSQDVEFGGFYGIMSVEDFGVNVVQGAFLSYHVTEDIFVTASYGETTTERTSFERLSGVDLLTDEQRELQYYDLSVGLNILPGEGFIGDTWSFNSAFYVTGGVGSTEFAGDQRFTIAWSAGYKMIVMDYLALHVEIEEHLFDIDILGATKISDNVSLQAGFSVYF